MREKRGERELKREERDNKEREGGQATPRADCGLVHGPGREGDLERERSERIG